MATLQRSFRWPHLRSAEVPAFGTLRLLAAGAGLALGLAACSSGGSTPGVTPTRSTARRSSTTSTSVAPHVPVVKVSLAPWTLPRASARAVLVADGSRLLLLGGLDGNRQTTSEVLALDPATGTVAKVGALGAAVHDAAGALVNGAPMVFGGGNSTETAAVQAFGPDGGSHVVGRLPIPRSDLAAATLGARTFLVGGYDGSSIRATALATTDGMTFTLLGDLPVPVRYPAVAALGTAVYVIGGSTADGAVRTVQLLDTTTGTTRTIGDLPETLSDAVAATVSGRVYVFGGEWGGRPSAQVWRLDVGSGAAPGATLTPVATLSTPVVDAAVAVLGDRAYLVGGESPAILSTVSVLEVR